ncbi:MAG: Ribosomal RNA small subunit methyltransferase A [Candidatus Magasanikbacteria bacterium GW2011_GWA2_45_39]|uniref:Ribosomal RNA small subunit methyltransferase A n=2 Tax=Candidatus Magasanikiibacteriota TaxID=1752731 RepID=A0A0G1Q6B0_9BACT|nr:MAG: Ribosomal RNA small subunit methyltransferase A [Candidatus Magasanikbacteria bacterium GW2011_GWA2_45_39]KKU13278.1 MAG: Ribosomal RNA small subunit methyltransferase A [Candidatus Magasanikbacteria bacterium GW2011_GWC2_45_8]
MLTDLKTIKQICARHHLKPDKNFGQNFLIDENVLQDIVDAAEIQKTDTIIEIGAGVGTLTSALAKRAGQVYAFEVDERLYPVLQETVSQKNVEIIKENILQTRVRWEQIILSSGRVQRSLGNGALCMAGNYKIVANIPYSITGILLRLFTELVVPPARAVLMVQKEVAERITARPGKMNMLSVVVQYYTVPELIRAVPGNAFYPSPKVDSAVLAWRPQRTYNTQVDEPFFRLVRAGFLHPRKMLKNNLISAWKDRVEASKITQVLSVTHIPERARPGDLTVENWLNLCETLRH